MKFYRVSLMDGGEGHQGFAWFTNRKAAEKRRRKFIDDCGFGALEAEAVTIEQIEVVPTRAGILLALNHFADHPNNG